MAIDLPPPPMPEQASLQTIDVKGAPAVFSIELGGTHLQVFGPPLPEADLRALLAQAQTQSDAVYAVRNIYYSIGYLTARIFYALDGNQLSVFLLPQAIASVEVPEPYHDYFQPLQQRQLDVGALETARVLASTHADRAGEHLQLALQPASGGVDLLMQPAGEAPAPGSVTAGFGNPGNRFLGRYFADLAARRGFRSGDEFSVGGHYGFPKLDDKSNEADYADVSAGWSHVSPYGIFGIAGTYIDYAQQPELEGTTVPYEFQGDIRQAEMAWQNLLSASLTHRWTLGAKLDYTWKRLLLEPLDMALQRQVYASVEASTGYRFSAVGFNRSWDFDLALALRKGLGDDGSDDPQIGADLGYWLLRPELNLSVPLTASHGLGLRLSGQWTEERLPEQQQWVLGGRKLIEAYLPGVAVGDSGVLAHLRWEALLAEAWGFRVLPALFAEYGLARYSDTASVAAGNGRTCSLADLGASLSIQWRQYLSLNVSAAAPLGSTGIDKDARDDSRADVLFRIEMRL